MKTGEVEWEADPHTYEEGIVVTAQWDIQGHDDRACVRYVITRDPKGWRDALLQMIGAVGICLIMYSEIEDHSKPTATVTLH